MPQKSIKRNYLYHLLYQLLAFLTPLATTPYIARVLGPDGIGINSYTSSLTMYFILFAIFGTSDYGQREIAYHQDSPVKRTSLFWEIFLLRCGNSLVSVILFLFVTGGSGYQLYFAIQSIHILSVAFDISWFFQGMEEFGKIVFKNSLIRLLNIVLIFAFVKDRGDLPFYIASIAVTTLLGHITVWVSLPQYLVRVKIGELRPFHNMHGMVQFFIPSIAIQISAVLDKTMLGAFAGSAYENGYYEQAERIEKICLTIVSALGAVMIPRISYLFSNNRMDSVEIYIYRSYRFIEMMAFPMIFGIWTVADIFVPWFLGPGYEKTVLLARIFSVLLLLVGFSNVTGMQYFIPTGRQRQFTCSVILGCLVNVILNLILIPRYLSIGAACATVIGESVVTIFQFIMARDRFSCRRIAKTSGKYLLSAAVMAVLLLSLKNGLKGTTAGMLSLISVGVASYFFLLWILREEIVMEVYKKILKSAGIRIR